MHKEHSIHLMIFAELIPTKAIEKFMYAKKLHFLFCCTHKPWWNFSINNREREEVAGGELQISWIIFFSLFQFELLMHSKLSIIEWLIE